MKVKAWVGVALLAATAGAGVMLVARPTPPPSRPTASSPTPALAVPASPPALRRPLAPAAPTPSATVPVSPPPAPQGMRPQVWARALAARQCAERRGEIDHGAALAIIDYDLPSSRKRLWVVDPTEEHVLLNEWVAHGSGSGQLRARAFSNQEGSFQTSLGVFRAAEVYEGKHGTSLRLDGLEEGFNDQARNRAIVVHAAWYAEPSMVEKTGRLGRSQGCPAVREKALDSLRDALSDGGMLFAYASEQEWLEESTFLNCHAA